MEQTLLRLLRVLNESGICAAARMLSDGRIEVWLGDADYGIRASALFGRSERAEAGRWLCANALRFYPHSAYARDCSLISGWVAGAIQQS